MKVLFIRPNRNANDAAEFEDQGFETLIDPYLEISRFENPKGALRMLEALRASKSKWFVNSSVNGFEHFIAQLPVGSFESIDESTIRFAAIGETTRQQLLDYGIKEVLVSSEVTGLSLAEKMLEIERAPVVIPAGTLAMRQIPDQFSSAELEVISETVYQTQPVEKIPDSASLVASGEVAAVVFRSPSAVRAFLQFNPNPKIRFICLGPTTAKQLEMLGFNCDVVSVEGDVCAAARALQEMVGEN